MSKVFYCGLLIVLLAASVRFRPEYLRFFHRSRHRLERQRRANASITARNTGTAAVFNSVRMAKACSGSATCRSACTTSPVN